jgi:FMN phosphatase YigB (HAD superfamily)
MARVDPDRGIGTGYLTEAAYRRRFAAELGLSSAQADEFIAELFDVIIYSHEVGLVKPDPRIYALLCAELSMSPDEVVFLDDVRQYVEAACQFGIHGLLHRSTPESIAAIDSLIAA